MNLDYESIWTWVKDRKALFIGLLLAIFLALFLGYLSDAWTTFWDWREINNINANIKAVEVEANKVNANIANLAVQDEIKRQEVEKQGENHNAAKNATDEARNATNGALANYANTQNRNFNNSSLNQAEKARCAAFPARCR